MSRKIPTFPKEWEKKMSRTKKQISEAIKKVKDNKLITIQAPVGTLIVPKDMMLSWAVKTLTEALKKDKELYYAYQANIAMPFKDRCARAKKEGKYLSAEILHEIANGAARDFLDLLCEKEKYRVTKNKMGKTEIWDGEDKVGVQG